MRILAHLFLALSLLSASPIARAQDDEDPSIKLLPVTPQIEATATKVLQDCKPQDGKIAGEVNKNGVYTLTGGLFHNGKIYALIDDTQDVLLCEWQKPAWRTVTAISAETEWNWPTGYRPQDGRSPDNQPQPFWMLYLQDRPLLVIATRVDKAGQNYHVLLLDSKFQKILASDYSFGDPPEVKHQFLITGDGSRNKAEWGGTYYSKLQGNAFVVLKSWEDSQPWHAIDREDQPDDSSNSASSDGNSYDILPDNSGDKNPADYLIYRKDPKASTSIPDTTGGLPAAEIYFTPNKNFIGGYDLVYIFQKLTALPKDLFPGYENFRTEGKPEPKFKVRVTGNDKSLVKLLSPN